MFISESAKRIKKQEFEKLSYVAQVSYLKDFPNSSFKKLLKSKPGTSTNNTGNSDLRSLEKTVIALRDKYTKLAKEYKKLTAKLDKAEDALEDGYDEEDLGFDYEQLLDDHEEMGKQVKRLKGKLSDATKRVSQVSPTSQFSHYRVKL